MHGPKIEYKRRKGEENAAIALACGGGKEQVDDVPAPMPSRAEERSSAMR